MALSLIGSQMIDEALDGWMQALGYDPGSHSLHLAGSGLKTRHPYAPELHDLLNPSGDIAAAAVFDVEGVPTVCFFMDDGSLLNDEVRLAAIRERIWNQNLISLVLILTPDFVVPVPTTRRAAPAEPVLRVQARPDGPLSSADVQSGDLWARYQSWFRMEDRVDHKLLLNLKETVRSLSGETQTDQQPPHLTLSEAHYLVAQVLFVSYLEHRGIVGERYREKHRVGSLFDLVSARNRQGIIRLLTRLKTDCNGDFLEPKAGAQRLWLRLSDSSFDVLTEFLSATDMDTKQLNIWPYNFRYIPVELLSGIYEAFLGKDSKKQIAAYYTPRHLANLVVDQALRDSKDLLAECIYDGACGSGILLTTAFRRLLGEAEARRGGAQLPLEDRIALLREHIFGSDVSDAACRVTAFSLYLSLLERLKPSDISALCDDKKVKLPKLRGRNLFGGSRTGEFFSNANPLVRRGGFTLFLCNPPWVEPSGSANSPADRWARRNRVPRALRQLAADFAWRAMSCLTPDGRLCLILPMSLLLKPTSQAYLAAWLERVSWKRIINFGDLKELLFEDGRKSCVVLLATPRSIEEGARWIIPPSEEFEYLVPKADVSLAFGRLALHSSDRHSVQTQAIALSNRQLTTRMWGDEFDLALWAELRLRGTFQNLFIGSNKRWTRRKGFHRIDNSIERSDWVSSKPLWRMRFIRPADLYAAPIVDLSQNRYFPSDEMPLLPHLGEDLLAVFTGPQILFPDGPSPELEIRAAFNDQIGCFMSSIGVISGPPSDNELLRFATVYLRSDLVRYFMVTQLYQLLSDRDRVSLSDIAHFPFYLPERHQDPPRALGIISEVAELTREVERAPSIMRPHLWLQLRDIAEKRLQSYFGLSDRASALVRETVDVVLPRIRPYGLTSVFERAGRRPSDQAIDAYVETLNSELAAWRDARRGQGQFKVQALLTNPGRAGPFGIVRATIGSGDYDPVHVNRNDEVVRAIVRELQNANLLPAAFAEGFYFAPDTVVVAGDAVYLIKPQTELVWLRRQAVRDAERIVDATTRPTATARKVACCRQAHGSRRFLREMHVRWQVRFVRCGMN
jgi:hypothetical protein